jgi:hypothetical protein
MVSLLHSIYGGTHVKDAGLGHYVSYAKSYHLPCGRRGHKSEENRISKRMYLIFGL